MGKLAELGHGHEGAGGLVEVLSDALQEDLSSAVFGAGKLVSHNNAMYLQQLTNYRIPGFEWGDFRAFEVDGDSMEPTINHRDIVVASRVEELRLLEPGYV